LKHAAGTAPSRIAGTLRAVIFDMDGVLCDSEPFICEAARIMFRKRHGVAAKPADFIPFVGAGEDRYLGGVAELHGVRLNLASDKAFVYSTYLEIIRGRLRPLPGAKEFVAACGARGLSMAVATSADRVKLEGNLREIGIPEALFGACVTGDDIERKKPFPDIFLLAAQRLGIAPAECLVVEDAPNGIRAAKTAGAPALGLTSSFPAEELVSNGADWVAADLSAVPGECLLALAMRD